MTMIEELWKTTPNDVYLEVSTFGRARRKQRPLIYKDGRKGFLPAGYLRGSLMNSGYITISSGNKKYLLHRLIAETFLEKPTTVFSYQTVNHKNGIKTDNRLENIEWATYKQNNDHARDTGLCKQHGNNTNLTKFSEQLVSAMKRVKAKYDTPVSELAVLFDMSTAHVYEILRGTSRKRG
jgi:hypothetical protein